MLISSTVLDAIFNSKQRGPLLLSEYSKFPTLQCSPPLPFPLPLTSEQIQVFSFHLKVPTPSPVGRGQKFMIWGPMKALVDASSKGQEMFSMEHTVPLLFIGKSTSPVAKRCPRWRYLLPGRPRSCQRCPHWSIEKHISYLELPDPLRDTPIEVCSATWKWKWKCTLLPGTTYKCCLQ